MEAKSKTKTIALVLVTVVTVVLAIVAVVTALKLQQFAKVPVSPNAPASQPKAAFNTPTNQACQTSFTVTASSSPSPSPTTGSVTCESKTVYKGTTKLASGATVAVGDVLTYKIKLTSTDSSQTGSSTITDVLDAGLTFGTAGTNCTYNQLNRTLTCTTTNPLDELSFTATVNSTAGTTLANSATVTAPDTKTSTCAVSVVLKTPTSCNNACSVDADCSGNLICETGSKTCRNPSCSGESSCACATPTPTPTPTPTATPLSGCNQTCTVDADCSGNLICESGQCRNPSCTQSNSCVCTSTSTPVPGTATPVPEAKLPTAGNSLPTASILLMGLGVITLGVVGMLGL